MGRILSALLFCLLGMSTLSADDFTPRLRRLTLASPGRHVAPAKSLISIQGLVIPDRDAFREKIRPYLGRELTDELVLEMKERIVEFYKARGFFLARVIVPEGQNLTGGGLVLEIAEGRCGEIKTTDSPKWFSDVQVMNNMTVEPGDLFQWKQIRKDLDWVNQNPFRQTTLVFEPSAREGEVDLLVSTKDRFPVRAYAGYENTGNLLAGNSRYLAGFECGNMWGANHQWNLMFITSSDLPDYRGVTMSYLAPLPWRNRVELFGTYTKAQLNGRHGWGAQGVGKYLIPFWLGDYKQQLGIGYVFRRSNNVLEFGESFIHMFDISEFMVTYESAFELMRCKTNLTLSLFLSPGNMTPNNNDYDFTSIRPGAHANYAYGKLELDNMMALPGEFAWDLNFIFQYATGALMPTEELSLGGFATVRGYEENAIISDNGALLKNEFRFPAWKLPASKGTTHNLQFLLFLDAGWGNDVDPNIYSHGTAFLSSAGPGVRYQLNNYISARFDYGWQLHTITRRTDNVSYHSRGHLGTMLAF